MNGKRYCECPPDWACCFRRDCVRVMERIRAMRRAMEATARRGTESRKMMPLPPNDNAQVQE